MQLFQLLRLNGRGRICHHIASCLILGEGDHFADVGFVREEHDEAVNARRHAAVRGSAVFKSFEHVTELGLNIFIAHPKHLEHLHLDVAAMNADRARSRLISIADHIVRVGCHCARVCVKLVEVFHLWHGKRMMLRLPSFGFFVIREEWKVHDPCKSHHVFVGKV